MSLPAVNVETEYLFETKNHIINYVINHVINDMIFCTAFALIAFAKGYGILKRSPVPDGTGRGGWDCVVHCMVHYDVGTFFIDNYNSTKW